MKVSIVSAVSRHLLVRDINTSLAFYTGKLGFSQLPVPEGYPPELVCGPARIMLHTTTGACDGSGPLRAGGSPMVFFETDHVVELHKALTENGSAPSEVEKVNWIKMQLFMVTDPDGHRLWFGQSYHEFYSEMHAPGKKGQLRKSLPCFPCTDVPAAVGYYAGVLGFSVNYQQHDLGVMDRDEVTILLMQATEKNRGTGRCCIYISNADELHAALVAKDVRVTEEPVSHPWGLRMFSILDQEGNRIDFAQTFE